jgi:hypothetical protein
MGVTGRSASNEEWKSKDDDEGNGTRSDIQMGA